MTTAEKKDWYLGQFEKFERGLNGQSASPLHAWRKKAIARFAELSFPTARNEDWRYTNIDALLSQTFEPSPNYIKGSVALRSIEPFFIKDLACVRLVFINGRFAEDLSSPLPPEIKKLSESAPEDTSLIQSYFEKDSASSGEIFTTLNSAFVTDGACIRIPDGVLFEKPIHLLYLTDASAGAVSAPPLNLIRAGRESQVSVIETYGSLDTNVSFTNSVTLISAGENSTVHYVKLQNENNKTYHVDSTYLEQEKNSRFMSTLVTLGGHFTRNLIRAQLNGEGITCTLNGLYVTQDDHHTDNRTVIHHARPHCDSHELYKGILDGKSTAVFNGKIIVHPDAQKTDAKQSNKNLLLSKDATVNTKPQLEIFADDVKCTHGATIGRLDEEALFYLRSRGIAVDRAKSLLTYAFASDVVGRITSEGVRSHLDRLLSERLGNTR